MSFESKKLREERAALGKQANDILTKAKAENRSLTAEDKQTFDNLHAKIEEMRGDIERIEKQEKLDAEISEIRSAKDLREDGRGRDENAGGEITAAHRSRALRSWLKAGSDKPLTDKELRNARRCRLNPNSRVLKFQLARKAPKTIAEARALSVGTTTAGGYTVPQGFLNSLEEAMLAFGGMRSVSTIIRTAGGGDLPMPTVNDTANEGEIIGENSTANEQDVTFGQTVLGAYKYSSKMVKVSMELLQDSAFDLENWLGTALGTRIARITNRHFTKGTGTSQPRGVAVAATLGVTASPIDVLDWVDLVSLEHSVDPAYRMNARYMLHDSVLEAAKKLVDGENRPLWQAGIGSGAPDRINGYPYVINQHLEAVSDETGDNQAVLFGDFSKYVIRDVLGVSLQRLDERYAEYGQVAFLAWSRHDGDLLDAGTNPVKYLDL